MIHSFSGVWIWLQVNASFIHEITWLWSASDKFFHVWLIWILHKARAQWNPGAVESCKMVLLPCKCRGKFFHPCPHNKIPKIAYAKSVLPDSVIFCYNRCGLWYNRINCSNSNHYPVNPAVCFYDRRDWSVRKASSLCNYLYSCKLFSVVWWYFYCFCGWWLCHTLADYFLLRLCGKASTHSSLVELLELFRAAHSCTSGIISDCQSASLSQLCEHGFSKSSIIWCSCNNSMTGISLWLSFGSIKLHSKCSSTSPGAVGSIYF